MFLHAHVIYLHTAYVSVVMKTMRSLFILYEGDASLSFCIISIIELKIFNYRFLKFYAHLSILGGFILIIKVMLYIHFFIFLIIHASFFRASLMTPKLYQPLVKPASMSKSTGLFFDCTSNCVLLTCLHLSASPSELTTAPNISFNFSCCFFNASIMRIFFSGLYGSKDDQK